ncbi:MAG: high-affinity nickel-transporter, partial [Halothece sp. Uz-M2-17]|nr:high-affinity nickel-transporter [Halothece sp. Uz-M2-17]
MRRWKGLIWGCLGFAVTLFLSGIFASKTVAHVNDLSLADIKISQQKAAVQFTLPIDFIRFADDNNNGRIEAEEVKNNQTHLNT